MFDISINAFTVLRVLIAFLLDRPLFAFAFGNLVSSLIKGDGILEAIVVLFLLTAIEFYLANIGAEVKSFSSIDDGLKLIERVSVEAELTELTNDEIVEHFGDSLVKELETFKWMKVSMIRKLGIEPKMSRITDAFKVYQVSGIPITPTAFATTAGGIAIVLVPKIKEKLSTYQKFLLLHEFGHITPTQNIYDKKRFIERVLSSLFGSIFLIIYVVSPWKYLGLVFLLFRYLNLTTANYTALNECQANHFAFQRLSEAELIEVNNILSRRWQTQLANKKDKNLKRNLSITKEIIVEKQLEYMEKFKDSLEFRKKPHFGRQEGFLSAYALSLLSLFLLISNDYNAPKFYLALGLLVIIHFMLKGFKKEIEKTRLILEQLLAKI